MKQLPLPHRFFLACFIYFITNLTISHLPQSPLVAAAPSTGKLPNVLILYADDLGYGDVNIQNADSKIPTPNIDALAKQGMRFTDGHSSSGICSPSRYALLTGRHHWRDFHGIVDAFGASVFKPNQLTIGEMLKNKGYQTACIGKWHLGWDWNAVRKNNNKSAVSPQDFDWTKPIPDGPLAHGFDYYFGDTVINFPPYGWIENDKMPVAPTVMMDTKTWPPIKEGNWECRPGPMVEGWNPYDVLPTLTQKGAEYIASRKESDSPFFLYFAFPSPHAPIIPNDQFDGKSQAGAYGDFVYQTDHVVGVLLDALQQSGLSDNTIVIFTADNGPEQYAYARDAKFEHWSAAPFRGLKRDIYEGGHHVPFIIRWPGVTKPGSVADALVSQVDIMATLATAVNFALPTDAAHDSHDLLPLLTGLTSTVRDHHIHNTKVNQYAIRKNQWLLIDSPTGYVSKVNPAWLKKRDYPSDSHEVVELYDLSNDIGQKNNLASEHPEIVKEMQELLAKVRQQGYSAPRLAPK